jgi:dTDP-glucose 4,6-dehydratase
MRRFFITGGAGFIGSHLCEHIFMTFRTSHITIVDKLTYSSDIKYLANIIKSKRVKFIKSDILDDKNYASHLKNVDIAINVAAESHVDNSFKNALNFTKTNTLGAQVFLMSCLKMDVKKILHISTDEVYGEKIHGRSKETDNFNPTNPYSASKAAAEMIINAYTKFNKNKILIVRSNNIYGTRQYPEKLIPVVITSLIAKKKIPIHGTGKYLRCFLSVHDFCNALVLLIKKNKTGIYNIGNIKNYSNIQIVKIISKFLNIDYKKNIIFIKNRLFNDRKYSLNINKIKSLGWRPKNNLKEELPKIIEWYKKNIFYYKKNFFD